MILILILVIAVALALLIFSPIGSYIFGALGRTGTVGGQTSISVLSVTISDDGSTMTIYVKNLGPNDVGSADSPADDTTKWQVFVDNTNYEVDGITEGGTDDGIFSVEEVFTLTVTETAGTFSKTKSYTIVVYGPGGTQTEYLYRGG